MSIFSALSAPLIFQICAPPQRMGGGSPGHWTSHSIFSWLGLFFSLYFTTRWLQISRRRQAPGQPWEPSTGFCIHKVGSTHWSTQPQKTLCLFFSRNIKKLRIMLTLFNLLFGRLMDIMMSFHGYILLYSILQIHRKLWNFTRNVIVVSFITYHFFSLWTAWKTDCTAIVKYFWFLRFWFSVFLPTPFSKFTQTQIISLSD